MANGSQGLGRRAAQPTEAPSGFNDTKHNCNERPGRSVGRYCGRRTLVGRVGEKYTHRRFRCKSYACARCGPRKIRQVRKRIVQLSVENDLTRFLTLTLDPAKLPPGADTKSKIDYLYETWRKMRVSISRKLGKSVRFIAVVELQGNGNPHLHALVGSYIPKEWISVAWQRVGGGWATRIERADVHRISAYLAKYLTDDSLRDIPAGARRFSASLGLALFNRTKSGDCWVLLESPIEYWHAQSKGTGAEAFETEQDGAKRLSSFVADRVPLFLADRLRPGAAFILSIEVRRRPR